MFTRIIHFSLKGRKKTFVLLYGVTQQAETDGV